MLWLTRAKTAWAASRVSCCAWIFAIAAVTSVSSSALRSSVELDLGRLEALDELVDAVAARALLAAHAGDMVDPGERARRSRRSIAVESPPSSAAAASATIAARSRGPLGGRHLLEHLLAGRRRR